MPPAPSHAVLRYVRKLAGASARGDSTDGQLLARFLRDRDENAFATLVDRHGPMVLNVCRRRLADANDVDDAFQAVFLVLVKKARSIHRPALLGNWLYGVACRAAANARRQAWRRQSRTKEIVEMPATEPASAEGWHEVRPLLDEELERLPEKYRAPLVLCYLQGKTYAEAARVLGWADGTVSGRLARGRALLRAALLKRGLTLSAAALTALLTQQAAEATTVPASLAASTVKAALRVAAGTSLAAGVSTHAAALTEGVLHAMFLTKLKIATAVVLTLAVLGVGGGMATYNTWARDKGQEDKDAAPSKDKGQSQPRVGPSAPAPAEQPFPLPVAKPAKEDRSGEMHLALDKAIDYQGWDDPKAGLHELLDELAARFDFTYIVNERAFEAEGLDDILSIPVAGKTPLPKMKGVRVATVLKKILSRLRSLSGATFVVRTDHIEITTTAALRNELGLPAVPGVALLPLVTASFDKTPIDQALKVMTEATGFNIVLDAAKLEKNQPAVTASFQNVPVDTAARILAEMADMRAVLLDNVLFVTSKPAAERLQKEDDKRKGVEPEEKPAVKPKE
jgi:RNA polymerase sigma factor (sigma-70 family)